MQHLNLVGGQRDHYRETILQSRASLPQNSHLGEKVATTTDVVIHYSFDFAQQIFIPNSSQQVGPLYFLVPYKLALFGVMCEPTEKMVIYVIPEAVLVSKSSNMVISLLHHFLTKCSVGETKMVLNADNCVGQNKNSTVMQYMMWQVATAATCQTEVAFMVVGHTKFGPDFGFGVFKRLYRRADINTVTDVCRLTESSKLLTAEPVGTEAGEVLIPCYHWQSKFAGIKKLHHFLFDSTKPQTVTVKEFVGEPPAEMTLVAGNVAALSADRQKTFRLQFYCIQPSNARRILYVVG